MTAELLAGLLAGYSVAIPVGPVGAYLVELTARTSLRVGAAAALGVATVDGGYAAAAMLGGAALADALSPALAALRWVSVAVLIATVIYFAALVVGLRSGSAPTALGQALFVAAVLIASASWQLVLACGGALLGRSLTSVRGRRWAALVSGVLIGVLALKPAS